VGDQGKIKQVGEDLDSLAQEQTEGGGGKGRTKEVSLTRTSLEENNLSSVTLPSQLKIYLNADA